MTKRDIEKEFDAYAKGVEEGKKHSTPSGQTIKMFDEIKKEMQEKFESIEEKIARIATSTELLQKDFSFLSRTLEHHMLAEEKGILGLTKLLDKKADKWVERVIVKINWLIVSAVLVAILSLVVIVAK